MILEKTQQLADLTAQLSEILMTAAVCADEMRAILVLEIDSHTGARCGRSQDGKLREPSRGRPLVDSSTFSVFWAGKSCRLRRTMLFRLAERLVRQPNQYVTADQFLHDVWEGSVKSPDTIRSAIRRLRQRLSDAGMNGVADAIQGTGGRYGLILDGNR